MSDMNQSDDPYIPSFLLKFPLQPEARGRYTPVDDFLENIQAWTGFVHLDECEE